MTYFVYKIFWWVTFVKGDKWEGDIRKNQAYIRRGGHELAFQVGLICYHTFVLLDILFKSWIVWDNNEDGSGCGKKEEEKCSWHAEWKFGKIPGMFKKDFMKLFTWYIDWQHFPFSTLKLFLHCLCACTVFIKKPFIFLVPLYKTCLYFLLLLGSSL